MKHDKDIAKRRIQTIKRLGVQWFNNLTTSSKVVFGLTILAELWLCISLYADFYDLMTVFFVLLTVFGLIIGACGWGVAIFMRLVLDWLDEQSSGN